MNRIVLQLAACLAILIVLAITPVKANDFAFWSMTADGADHLAQFRFGYNWEALLGDKVETGAVLKYESPGDDYLPEPDLVGVYTIVHDLVTIGKVDAPEGWLDSFLARPYAGLETVIRTHGDYKKFKLNGIVGTLFSTDPNFKWAIALEFQTGALIGAESEQVWMVGGRLGF